MLQVSLALENGRGQAKHVACSVRFNTFVVFNGNIYIATNFSAVLLLSRFPTKIFQPLKLSRWCMYCQY